MGKGLQTKGGRHTFVRFLMRVSRSVSMHFAVAALKIDAKERFRVEAKRACVVCVFSISFFWGGTP